MNTTSVASNRPSTINQKHWNEWIVGSGVSPEITAASIRSFSGEDSQRKAIATAMRYKGWKNGGGWIVRGVDPSTGKERLEGTQFKPDCPPIMLDGSGKPKLDGSGNPKFQKYLSRKGDEPTPLFLPSSVPDFWLNVRTDDGIPIFITEGAKKSGCLLSHNYACISVPGVSCGQKFDRLHEELAQFAQDRKVYLCFDADWQTNPNVVSELSKLALLLRHAKAIVYIVSWDLQLGKGLDDLIVNHGIEAFQQALEQAQTFKEWQAQRPAEATEQKPAVENRSIIPVQYDKHGNPLLPKASTTANALLERYRETLIWSIETKKFFRYEAELPGLWSREPQEQLKAEIAAELDRAGLEYSSSYVNSVLELIGNKIALKRWTEPKDLIPMQNGVLNRLDMRLLPHDPKYRFRWQLPYGFTEDTNCKPILDWLLEAMDGHQDRVDVLLAYLKAIVTSRVDLQRFLECIGEGGTGKGTFLRLAMALTGKINSLPTSLKHLEGNRFETASIYGKRLVAITDSEKYSGDISTLKALTGQDLIRYEVKGIQQGDGADAGFYPDAMVVIASNEPIRSLDHTSGIQRRRITIPFNHQPASSDRRDLISFSSDTITGEFASYLPALLTHILLIPDERVTELVRDTDKHCPSLKEAMQENFLETNPLAEWVDSNLVVLPGHKTYVGSAKKMRYTKGTNTDGAVSTFSWDEYAKTDEWLYANYRQWCDRAGGSHPVTMKSFSKQLVSLCKAQLKIQGIEKGSDRSGAFISGLAIRADNHSQLPTPVTGRMLIEKNDSSMDVMDCVMDCDGCVMAETLGSDGLYGCDGLFANSQEFEKNERNLMIRCDSAPMEVELRSQNKEKEEKLPLNPSHPSQSVACKGSSHHTSITHPSQPITTHHKFNVGDRVWSHSKKAQGVVLVVGDGEARVDFGSTTCWQPLAQLVDVNPEV